MSLFIHVHSQLTLVYRRRARDVLLTGPWDGVVKVATSNPGIPGFVSPIEAYTNFVTYLSEGTNLDFFVLFVSVGLLLLFPRRRTPE